MGILLCFLNFYRLRHSKISVGSDISQRKLIQTIIHIQRSCVAELMGLDAAASSA